VSKHWKPDGKIARIVPVDRAPRAVWPVGATVGLALVAVCCIGAAVLLYHVAGPSDVFAP
jgi:hypothetical protein